MLGFKYFIGTTHPIQQTHGRNTSYSLNHYNGYFNWNNIVVNAQILLF